MEALIEDRDVAELANDTIDWSSDNMQNIHVWFHAYPKLLCIFINNKKTY